MSPPSPERVLVVDDDVFVIEALDLLLSDYWHVHTALSVREAKAVLKREDIAVILSDQRMPLESGVDLLAWAHVNYPDAVRILLTGYTDVDTVVTAINRGRVWHYVRKPWENANVITMVRRAIELREKEREATCRFHGAIRSLVVALEASHPYTSGHSQRVTRYSKVLCDGLGLSSREHSAVILAAQLHDIGKIGVDKRYLDMEGDLDETAWENVRQHVGVGERIIEETGFLDHIIPLVVSHHERMDGGGYPRGLKGEEIPPGRAHHLSGGRLRRHDLRPRLPQGPLAGGGPQGGLSTRWLSVRC